MSTATSRLSFPDPFEVTVSFKDGKISVSPESIEVNKEKGEHLVWVAEDGVDFYICFERDTPFVSHHFHKNNNSSGRPRSAATGRYKYFVEVDGHVLDPDVIVRP